MVKKLLIVESPAKAKTIEKFLGKDFKIKSSYGHIRDLDKGSKGIDINNNFKPNYVISSEKQKVVKELKDWTEKVEEVWLATDEDREGEAISWHLCEVLGLDPKKVNRIVFNEITKPAIQAAVKSPRHVDMDLVNAQQARRVLDRLVGFELSEILWRKVKNKLSAGRVQTVAVKLVVDREREINDFVAEQFYKVNALFETHGANSITKINAQLNNRFNDSEQAEAFLTDCQGSVFKVEGVEVKPTKRNPPPPFITSTLQQEASRKLGFGVNRTMNLAQKLYESGFISYMRTDSTFLSETAQSAIAQEITKQFGPEYVCTRQYKTKSALAQEAHEAIRPTYMDLRDAGHTADEKKLYDLIWKRAMASQMASADLEKTTVTISISKNKNYFFISEGEVLLFDGFLRLYRESTDEEEENTEGMLPPLKTNDVLEYISIEAVQRFTRPPARYTEASLVKKLEELGIGRPSTYAPTITKIMGENRGYVVKESREGSPRNYEVICLSNGKIERSTFSENVGAAKNALFPTDIGMVVCDYLSHHFKDIINYGFTAEIEKEFDEIAEGKLNWVRMIDDFYWPFHKTVDTVLEQGERAKGRRELGVDPATGRKVLVQLTRYGPVVQVGDRDELIPGEKPLFAKLRPGQNMENISFEQAMELFKLPKELGSFQNIPVSIGVGRFGPYIKYGEQNISLPKGKDPLDVDMDYAITLIQKKSEEDAPIAHYKDLPITKGKGRFGPFIKWNGLFVNVPKRIDFNTIGLEECIPLIEAKLAKEDNRYIHQFPEYKITVENGRWGPFIKYGKKIINIPKVNGERVTSDMAARMSVDDFKRIVELEIPGAFESKNKTATENTQAGGSVGKAKKRSKKTTASKNK